MPWMDHLPRFLKRADGSGWSSEDASGEGHLFCDIRRVSESNARDQMEKQARCEKAKYKDSPIGSVAKSDIFERTTLVVIILNALAIGIDADYTARIGKEGHLYQSPLYFIITELCFTAYFSAEIAIRFVAYRRKIMLFCDAWFMFDSILVTFMVLEVCVLPFLGGGGPLGQLSVLRLLRLLRITRVAKLMHRFPELMVIVTGIKAAIKAVVWTAILLVIITCTWAILFTNEYHQGDMSNEEARDLDGAEHLFGSMGKSMRNLLVMGTILDDVTYATDTIRGSGNTLMLALFIAYILLNSFTLMNMLVGILVEVVGSTAESEKERFTGEQAMESIKTIFNKMDKDESGLVSRAEFLAMRNNQTVEKSLQSLDIKRKEFDMFVELLFDADEEGNERPISFAKLENMLMRLRPGTHVSALDFATLKQQVHVTQARISTRVGRIERLLDMLGRESHGLQSEPPSSADVNSLDAECSAYSKPELQVVLEEPKQLLNMNMLGELERSSSADIVAELQRRLGMPSLEEAGVPLSMMDEELQQRILAAEDFAIPGAPLP